MQVYLNQERQMKFAKASVIAISLFVCSVPVVAQTTTQDLAQSRMWYYRIPTTQASTSGTVGSDNQLAYTLKSSDNRRAYAR